ncbi:MAG: hypothetical protein HQ512_03475 [Rhodospirillales bacterium]|nr:hypothetical protein [Rhodospirillales bacterium]
MINAISGLLDKIRELEGEAERELETQRQKFHYTLTKKRIKFEAAVRQHHKELRKGLIRYILDSDLMAVLLAPLIYAQIVPLIMVDIAVTLFQWVCFPIYGIKKVPRDDFIAIDRHHLAYLNPIEKLNCAYCGYANGLLAYAREVAGRTEEHWCPIKHAHRTTGQHRRYYDFADYGDADGYRQRMEAGE